MRILFVCFVIVSSSLSGCFGSDELFDEPRGKPGGLALACLQDDKFEKCKYISILKVDTTLLLWI